jgi:hypothetical protein
MNTHTMCDVRDPDTLSMYTFNDHARYGVLEVVQNLILDFDEALTKADDNWRPMWAVVEATALFFASGRGTEFCMVEDGDMAIHTATMVGRMLVTALATLETRGALDPKAANGAPNVPVMMALMLKVADRLRCSSVLESDKTEKMHPIARKKTWVPDRFDRLVLAYARKHGIEPAGPKGIKKVVEECDAQREADGEDDVQLPDDDIKDTFGWAMELKILKRRGTAGSFFTSGMKRGSTWKGIGGDYFDLTTWPSAERKKKAFDEKDPLSKAQIKQIGEGAVLMLA